MFNQRKYYLTFNMPYTGTISLVCKSYQMHYLTFIFYFAAFCNFKEFIIRRNDCFLINLFCHRQRLHYIINLKLDHTCQYMRFLEIKNSFICNACTLNRKYWHRLNYPPCVSYFIQIGDNTSLNMKTYFLPETPSMH